MEYLGTIFWSVWIFKSCAYGDSCLIWTMAYEDLSSQFQHSWCFLFPVSPPTGPWWITDAWLLAEGEMNEHRMKCLTLQTGCFMFTVWTKQGGSKMICKCWYSLRDFGPELCISKQADKLEMLQVRKTKRATNTEDMNVSIGFYHRTGC